MVTDCDFKWLARPEQRALAFPKLLGDKNSAVVSGFGLSSRTESSQTLGFLEDSHLHDPRTLEQTVIRCDRNSIEYRYFYVLPPPPPSKRKKERKKEKNKEKKVVFSVNC